MVSWTHLPCVVAVIAIYGASEWSSASPSVNVSQCDEVAVVALHRDRALLNTNDLMKIPVRTVVHDRAVRSAGGAHDFYSEGDYWWPVAGDVKAPYERRDGESNPDNFVAHRLSLMRLADAVAGLTSAYIVTENSELATRYARRAEGHLQAWFVAPETRMNPDLRFAQAIKGRHTGRSIGIIDSVHLVEVALAAKLLISRNMLTADNTAAIRRWFDEYITWLNTHPNGIKEREHPNNHGVAWSLQMVTFSMLTEDSQRIDWVRKQFKQVYLAEMMADDGSFPRELARTKPFGYSLFILDLMAGIAQLASTEEDNLWLFKTPEGRSMGAGMRFIHPYIKNKSIWPYRQDVEHWESWPKRHAALLFGGYQLGRCDFFNTAKTLPMVTDNYEIRRNSPIRHPILWVAD